jgi:flavin-dependent dehydrogenase
VTELDVLIVGAGPAGSTLASTLLRHRKATRIAIVDKSAFPRFHVGETLVSDVNRVLDEMGAYDAVDRAGFVRKYGATFRWGSSDEPWDMLFATLDEIRAQSTGEIQTSYTWHVDRARYDALLLAHAASLGAQVSTGTGVRALVRENDRVVGAVLDDDRVLRARVVVDATGQSALENSRDDREMDPQLRNVAYWGYFEGCAFDARWNGTLDRSRAFIVAHEHGWSWLFPIRPDLVSVGVVTTLAMHKSRPQRAPEELYREAIASSPQLSALLADARLVPYAAGGPSVHRIQDFSYVSRSIATPGLVRVGDAAGFVDPILSVGCFLGQSFARHLAYGLRTVLDGDAALDESTIFEAYADHVRETLHAFREVTWFFYRFHERKDAWWAEARRLLEAFPAGASDHHAFTAFASGFAARRSIFREPNGVFGEPFFEDAFRRLVDPSAAPTRRDRPARTVADAMHPRLVGPVRTKASAIPLDGAGRVVPALRIEVETSHGTDGDRLIRRLLVPPSMAPLFPWLDGTADVASLSARLADALGVAPESRPDVARYVRGVVAGLEERALVTDG